MLTWLSLAGTPVNDLTPLQGMPLTLLEVRATSVRDLTPLKGMKLTNLWLDPARITKGMDMIRIMPSLATLNDLPAAEFWKKYDAGEFR